MAASSSNRSPQRQARADARAHAITRLVPDWFEWRRRFPIRAQSLVRTRNDRPKEAEQRAWHCYQSHNHDNGLMTQEWLMSEFLVDWDPHLRENRPQHDLWMGI